MLNHGIKVNEVIGGTRPLQSIATAVIGLVASSNDGNNDKFALNKPTLVTDIRQAINDAGDNGTLVRSLESIADQTNPVVVAVRVEEGINQEETNNNVIGDFTNDGYTGMKALLAAEAQVGIRPRILVAPGLDTQAVTVDLAAIARQMRGFVYAKANAGNVADAVTYRGNFSERELMLMWPDFKSGFDGDAVARAAGLRARIDTEIGWHKTLSNVAVSGVTGLSQDVFWNLQDNQTDAGILNDSEVTTLIRQNGFRFWGNRTCSDEPLFAFESTVRTAQVLRDTIAEGSMLAVDKPITGGLVRDIVETINAEFRRLISAERIIGGEAWFDKDANPREQLAAGRINIDYDFTPAAPAEDITLNQRITDRYYADLNLAA